MGDGSGGYMLREQYVVPQGKGEGEGGPNSGPAEGEGEGELALQPLPRVGYISIFPLLLKIPTSSGMCVLGQF